MRRKKEEKRKIRLNSVLVSIKVHIIDIDSLSLIIIEGVDVTMKYHPKVFFLESIKQVLKYETRVLLIKLYTCSNHCKISRHQTSGHTS